MNNQPLALVIDLMSLEVRIDISVAKLSPVITFSIELVNLSIMKSSPISDCFFTTLIYEKLSSDAAGRLRLLGF